jgi:calcineurin-like phosphoesterase family protein
MKIFVTSNQQFGRTGAIRMFKRPFDNVEEMNQSLIKKWNSVVSSEDTVYVLGNLIWQPESGENILKSLNGSILVIKGEYDKAIEDLVNLNSEVSVEYLPIGIKQLNALDAILSYWPMLDWPKKNKGSISFIGHPSNKYKSDHNAKVVNVRCDDWDFKPIEIQQIITLYHDPDLN